ncbi:MAG TPA: type II toxin-antitoxin system VapC family toxin [Rhodothermales bacterium]|nr:type II toxin-antitoxin system VapC family toxin [Rhodothermales bacterium]
MVLDTSAVIAVLQSEPAADRLIAAIEGAQVLTMSAASVLEASIVLFARYGDFGDREFDLFLHRLSVRVVSVTAEHVEMARSGYRRFGKGRHPAGLNFGDCFSYALALSLGEPLLSRGDAFSKTDVLVA